MILIVIKDIVLNGMHIHAGEYISTNNPDLFLGRGYARRLTTEEIIGILDDYVAYAEKLFNKMTG